MPEAPLLQPHPERSAAPDRPRRRWVSPLLRRILLVNALPPALLAASLLYLDQYQDGLIAAEVEALRAQARIYAGAIAEAAVRVQEDRPALVAELVRPLLRRLVEPSPDTQARLFDTSGLLVADSRVRESAAGIVTTEPLPPPAPRDPALGRLSGIYDRLRAILPARDAAFPRVREAATTEGQSFDWQPDFAPDRAELRLALEGRTEPYIRRTPDDRLLISVAEPARRGGQPVGFVLLTRDAREVEARLLEIRTSVLLLFVVALVLTVGLSLYLATTLATPMLQLARAAAAMRQGQGRGGSVPAHLLARRDEIGILARDLQAAARALWARIDANERFAADVAHELKNPLTSVRSAIETLRRVQDLGQQQRLLAIIATDAVRMDRLIADIADSSRVDAELSRAVAEPVDVAPILQVLAELHNTTRAEGEALVELAGAEGALVVMGVEDRLVQVFRNLLGNALSFSPRGGRVWLRAQEASATEMEFVVEDEGPGIPDAKLEGIFDRFYSERPRGERFGQHSGLGLSISKQIVEGLGGRISAGNRRDGGGQLQGARFVVRLRRPKA